MPAPFRLPPSPSSSQSSGIVAGEPHPLPFPASPWRPARWLSPPSTAAAASAALRHCSV
uniref:Uncharacterized protein n=1 Tax=Arundo donax TaxID=35708 RepID=A0A0A9DMM6_ARUDO